MTWNGEALDQKTPLLRADMAVNEQSVRLLALLGDTATREVACNVGWEQEFFLIDREKYLARPDLVATGRTLLGAPPLRGQEMSTNYFARLSLRVNRYVAEAREKMWELGISIHCTHNEVAPAQHEISPIFSLATRGEMIDGASVSASQIARSTSSISARLRWRARSPTREGTDSNSPRISVSSLRIRESGQKNAPPKRDKVDWYRGATR